MAKQANKPPTGARRGQSIVYLDNNATTPMCKPAIAAINHWLPIPANPSSSSCYGVAAKKMMDDARAFILAHCGVRTGYVTIFTSGASESNAFIIRSTVEAYRKQRKTKPHVLTSLTEHKSIIKCCEELDAAGAADITYVAPSISGCIPPGLIERGIQPHTCIVSIMSANNELGCINNLREIGAIAHAHKVPFHSDCVQTFGKFKYDLAANNIDAISVSFHKFGGPKGCGLLVINSDLISGYGLESQIAGTQEYGLRGGTENVASIAAGVESLKHAFTNRAQKNTKLYHQRQYIIDKLATYFDIGDYKQYIATPATSRRGVELVFLGTPNTKINQAKERRVLPNTLMIAVAKNVGEPFCNGKLKTELGNRGVIVSIGSACNTSSPDASHVLGAIRAPDVIRRGVIRVSLCDDTTKKDLDAFIAAFVKATKLQLSDVPA